MDRQIERRLMDQAVALGNSGQGEALQELLPLLASPSAQVRRLAASAVGKLADLADAGKAVSALLPLLRDAHPQTRQYAIKALAAYGARAQCSLPDLRDLAANTSEKDYIQRDAAKAVTTIEEALRIEEEQAEHRCQRCAKQVDATEYARSQRFFQRVFCDKCFDEVYLARRNFDTRVEDNKTIRTQSGTLVQSDGERMIADFLQRERIAFRYDERMRIVEGYAVRPDFYLPEFDVYIEYWGMDTTDYKIGMLKKLKLYQQEGKRLISLYPEDKPGMDTTLRQKLNRYMKI
ncbi:MAG: HEAT repeat domain-containing protein [Candidatus Sumerlaeota bacterium]|nr:HEAT repeat domain-containing protein [Candidatus Sumerlaeota bacterium]